MLLGAGRIKIGKRQNISKGKVLEKGKVIECPTMVEWNQGGINYGADMGINY